MEGLYKYCINWILFKQFLNYDVLESVFNVIVLIFRFCKRIYNNFYIVLKYLIIFIRYERVN